MLCVYSFHVERLQRYLLTIQKVNKMYYIRNIEVIDRYLRRYYVAKYG